MNWRLKPQFGPAQTAELEQALSTPTGRFPQALAAVLMQRGIQDLPDAKRYLQPSLAQLHDPSLLKDMELAVARVRRALEQKESVLLFGDYDVDGTTSVALMYLFFSDLGFEFEPYVPDRFTEGYGVSFEGIQYALETGCTLLIALDCGTKALDKIKFAVEKGIDVIVVDHHQPGAELPPTVAMINPLQPGCNYPDKSLSACGLAMKFCQAIHQHLPAAFTAHLPENYSPLSRYSDLLALSIACDIVPLRDENRILLHLGIEKLRRDPLPGIAALKSLDISGREWSVSDLVFYLGPRINSAGRLQHATAAVALLTGTAPDLAEVAASLDAVNEERKLLDKEITALAVHQITESEQARPRATTVLYDPTWNKGVIGIVASRLIERFHRPTILFTQSGDYLVGSGRSVPGFDLHAAIEACASHVVQFGGHKYAAGITLKSSEFQAFSDSFDAFVEANISLESRTPELWIDAPLTLGEIDERFIRLLRRMAPFGPSNPEPNFLVRGLRVKDVTVLKEQHIRFLFEQNGATVEGIAFFSAEKWQAVNALELDVVMQPDIKRWKDRQYVQLKVKDFRPAGLPLMD